MHLTLTANVIIVEEVKADDAQMEALDTKDAQLHLSL